MRELAKKCISEDPNERPSFVNIKKEIKKELQVVNADKYAKIISRMRTRLRKIPEFQRGLQTDHEKIKLIGEYLDKESTFLGVCFEEFKKLLLLNLFNEIPAYMDFHELIEESGDTCSIFYLIQAIEQFSRALAEQLCELLSIRSDESIMVYVIILQRTVAKIEDIYIPLHQEVYKEHNENLSRNLDLHRVDTSSLPTDKEKPYRNAIAMLQLIYSEDSVVKKFELFISMCDAIRREIEQYPKAISKVGADTIRRIFGYLITSIECPQLYSELVMLVNYATLLLNVVGEIPDNSLEEGNPTHYILQKIEDMKSVADFIRTLHLGKN